MLRGHREEGALETFSSACGNKNIFACPQLIAQALLSGISTHILHRSLVTGCAVSTWNPHRDRGTVIGNLDDWAVRYLREHLRPLMGCMSSKRVSPDDVPGWPGSVFINSSRSDP